LFGISPDFRVLKKLGNLTSSVVVLHFKSTRKEKALEIYFPKLLRHYEIALELLIVTKNKKRKVDERDFKKKST
jgi:hypothetical protein